MPCLTRTRTELRASEIALRRTEPGWRVAVLDKRVSRHVLRLRASEEGSGSQAPAPASGASNVKGEQRRIPSASDDDVGGVKAPRIARRCPGRANEQTRFSSASERGRQRLPSAILASGASNQTLRERLKLALLNAAPRHRLVMRHDRPATDPVVRDPGES
jgi:hypothetical protein